jgi:hypothetical protein
VALLGEVGQRACGGREVEAVGAAERVVVDAPAGAVLRDAVLEEILTVAAGLERQWRQEAVAEADIGDPWSIERHDQDEMIALRPPALARAADGARHVAHREPQRLEHAAEDAVHLEAPAAAALVDELGEHRLGIERDRQTQVDVEILVRDGQQVRAMQRPECAEVGAARPVVPHAGKVAIELGGRERTGHPTTLWRSATACRFAAPAGPDLRGYSVFRKAMSAALSSGESARPKGCPGTARAVTPAPLNPVGT